MKNKKLKINVDSEEIMLLLIGIWRKFRKTPGPADVLQTREFRGVVEAVKKMHESPAGKYFDDPEYLGAYLLYQWMVHYQQGLSIMGELPKKPHRVLDVASGPGSFAFAALKHGAQEVYAIDKNENALKLCGEVCGRYGFPVTVRRWNCPDKLPVEGQFDLIVVGHCLDELYPTVEGQRNFLAQLLKRLTPDGFLMVVDSSQLPVNKRILQIRDTLGAPIQAPCVWKGQCPALQMANSPCYAQREFEKPYLIREIQRAAEINLGSLKMTYIIFRNPESGWPELPNKKLYRIISPPVEGYQGKRYYLCGTDGKRTIGSHLKEHPPESRAFEYLKRGELISIEDALEKGHAYDLLENSKVIVEAPLGKPLPGVSKPHDS